MTYSTTRPGRRTLLTAMLGVFAASLPAQGPCTNPWLPSPGLPGVDGRVTDTLVFDPDGAGPLGERVLVAGRFALAGNTTVSNLAVYDPAARTWSPFGQGPYPQDLRLARDANGDLYVAGNFTSIAGVPIQGVARWDGSNWSALGSGLDGAVTAIEARPGGGVVVGGPFTTAGGLTVPNLAAWDGATWSNIGTPPFTGAAVTVLASHPGGALTIAARPSGTAYQQLLHFDGSTWSTISPSLTLVTDMLVTPGGELYVAGSNVPGGSAGDYFARWTGTGWVLLQGGQIVGPQAMALLPGGQLAAVGRTGSAANVVVQLWNGYTWTALGSTASLYGSLSVLSSGELLLGGEFVAIDGVPARSFARWNGSWAQPNNGLTGFVSSLAMRPDDSLFAAWSSASPGTGNALRYNGVTWENIGGGFYGGTGNNDFVNCMLTTSSGDVLLAGTNGWSPPQARPVVQRWNGTGSAWTTIATTSYTGRVDAIAELPDGDLVVGGQFQDIDGVTASNVARFNGLSWSAIGNGLPTQQAVKALAVSPSGELHALTHYGVFRWNGSHWQQLGLAVGGQPSALVFDHDGAPIIAGRDLSPDVLRWNGTAWVGLVDAAGNGPGGDAQSLCVLPDGDVVAGPRLGSSDPARPLQRWNGNSWSPLGGAIDDSVLAMTLARNGDLLLAGHFTLVGGEAQPHFARVTTTCPAPVTALGANCFSFAPRLEHRTAAWIGSTCRTEATVLFNDAIGIITMGTTPLAASLAALTSLPSNLCQLLLVPDAVQLAIPSGNLLPIEFAVPDNTALVGAAVRQQLITAQLDTGTGAIVGLRASNALEFQIGSF